MALELTQSRSAFLPRLPVRAIVAGPSGAGKGILVSKLLLDPRYYRDRFARVYYFSASAKVDHNLAPLKKYCDQELGQKEDCVYDTFDEGWLRDLLARQTKVTAYLKSQKAPRGVWGVCVVIDDFADDPSVVRRAGGILNSFFVRGRHANISTFLLTQKLRALDNMIRINATAFFCFRLRNRKDLEAFVEETSALLPRRTVEELYQRATAKPFGFLYVDLMAKTIETMFYSSFDSRLVLAPRHADARGVRGAGQTDDEVASR
jgi:hypothetical protein